MAWPSRNTRKLVVDGRTFLLQPRGVWYGVLPATAGAEGGRFYLTLEVSWLADHGSVRLATDMIRWALDHGWTPESGPNRKVECNEQDTIRWQDAKVAGKSN